jgi:tetratricopeptide (TPR) repeat protein
MSQVGSSAENRRIDSWKEIAAFFGRDERTVKRWEKERGLPVHRLPGERGGVFAWSAELTLWLNSANGRGREPLSAPDPAPVPEPAPNPAPVAAAPAPSPARPHWIWHSILTAAVVVLSLYAFHSFRVAWRQRSNPSAATHHVPDHEAQEFYLRGRYYWSRRTEGSLSQALDAFTQAVVHDSDYPQAYAGLAECYDLMPEFTSMPRSEAFPRAIAAAHKAISLDDSLAEAHRALGFALFYWEWRVPAALTEYQRALALDPRDEEAHHWYATSLLTLGQFQQARDEIDKAQQLDPASRSILCDQALIRFWAGDRDASIQKLREIEQAEPDFLSAPRYLARIAFDEKDYRTFIDQTNRLATLSKDEQLTATAAAAQSGLSKGGEHGMLDAMRLVQQHYFDSGQSSGFDLARTCALLGRKADAVTYLKAAIAAHDYMVLGLATDHAFAQLRGDPAFDEVQRQVSARMNRA